MRELHFDSLDQLFFCAEDKISDYREYAGIAGLYDYLSPEDDDSCMVDHVPTRRKNKK